MAGMTAVTAGQRSTEDRPDRLMSVPAAAKRMGVSAHILRNLVDSGAIDHFVIDNAILLSSAQIAEFLERAYRPRATP